MKKNLKLLLLTALLTALTLGFISTPLQAFAKVTYENDSYASSKKKSKGYFSDVAKKSAHFKDIEYLATRGAFKTLAKKGKKFKPEAIITRRQFCTILDNLYGDRINLTVKKPNSKVTQKFATDTLLDISKQLGYRVEWNGGKPKAKVTRRDAAYFICGMIYSAGGALDPYPTYSGPVTPQP